MARSPRILVIFAATLSLCGWPLSSQSTQAATPIPARFKAPLEKIFAASQAPGMVATIIDGDRVYMSGFGRTNATNNATPDEHTLVRLNSLSKLMAGEILAELVMRGTLSLADPLHRFEPTGRRNHNVATTQPITIRDLLIHTSRLPRDVPLQLWKQKGAAKDIRWTWLANTQPHQSPGRIAEYSNAAYLFLGDAMERATAKPYAALLAQYVTTPLQLTETTLAPTSTQCARLLAASRASCTSSHATAASWGVYATSEDIARWTQALMRAAPGTPRHASMQALVSRQELQAIRSLDFAGHAEAIGWGWLHMRIGNQIVLQKTGGGVRTMNYIIVSPEKRKSLFITVSRMDIEMLRNLTRESNRLMEQILNEAS